MKILHRIIAWNLRRKLVRQRVQNIRDIRANRRVTWEIQTKLARELRLAGASNVPRRESTRPASAFFLPDRVRTPGSQKNGRISAILRYVPKPEMRAA